MQAPRVHRPERVRRVAPVVLVREHLERPEPPEVLAPRRMPAGLAASTRRAVREASAQPAAPEL